MPSPMPPPPTRSGPASYRPSPPPQPAASPPPPSPPASGPRGEPRPQTEPANPRRQPYELKRTLGRIAWLSAAVVLCLGVLAFATGRGFSLTASQGGPSIEVDGLAGAVAPEQIDRSQPQLEAERAEANDQIAEETGLAAVDIAGDWFGDSSGAQYFIEQVGSAATITEFDAFGNLTAVGQGTLAGDQFSFSYDSAAGTSGFGQLSLDPTGSFLTGFWEDDFGRRPAQLSRL